MSLVNPEDPLLPVWQDNEQRPISCTEKVKVLNENYRELQQMLQDAIEDGVLMGVSEAQLRQLYSELVASVETRY